MNHRGNARVISDDDTTFNPEAIRGAIRYEIFDYIPRLERVNIQTKYKPMDEQVVKQLFTLWVSFITGSLVYKNVYFYNATASDNH